MKTGVQIPTRYGTFYAEATERGVYRLEFPGKTKNKKEGASSDGSSPYLARARKLLKHYLNGKKVSFAKLPFDLTGYTDFERSVLKKLSGVRWGERLCYQDLAARVGRPRASRAIGSVMRKNRLPILLPCHRVIRSGGRLGKYSKGQSWKRFLLTLESRSLDRNRPADTFKRRKSGF